MWPLSAAVLVGCAAQTDAPAATQVTVPETDTYIGALDDGNARIAIVRSGSKFNAYVCGKDNTITSHTRWFSGSLDQTDAGEISGEHWTLRVVASDTSLHGELVSPSGEPEAWTADAIAHDASSEVGLYDAREGGCRSGVIVWKAIAGPDCKAQGAWCDGSGFRGQVTPLLCTANEPLRVQGLRDDMKFDFIAQRVTAP
jgi:hypothetical protein